MAPHAAAQRSIMTFFCKRSEGMLGYLKIMSEPSEPHIFPSHRQESRFLPTSLAMALAWQFSLSSLDKNKEMLFDSPFILCFLVSLPSDVFYKNAMTIKDQLLRNLFKTTTMCLLWCRSVYTVHVRLHLLYGRLV